VYFYAVVCVTISCRATEYCCVGMLPIIDMFSEVIDVGCSVP